MKTQQIFISFSSQDKEVVDITCEKTEANVVKSWITPRDFMPGNFFAKDVIIQKLKTNRDWMI